MGDGKLRCAFTIIYNGLHHLKNRNFAKFMLTNFDHWIVVEGHAKPGGSTSWCKDINIPCRSTDGTHEELLGLKSQHKNLHYYSNGGYWKSKDEQVNKAIDILRGITNECILWQVDADEVWTETGIVNNERALMGRRHNCGRVQFRHIVGEHEGKLLIARGRWGSGYVNRVWKWKGERFVTHEPSEIEGQSSVNLPYRFDHYSMYFEQDVLFKSKYYKGYENLYENWKRMHEQGKFPYRGKDLHPMAAKTIIHELSRKKEGVLLRDSDN